MITRSLGVAGLLWMGSVVAANEVPWPEEEKAAMVAGCRSSIMDHTAQAFLERHNREHLPVGFRDKLRPVLEPYLASCDCAFDHLEKRWRFSYFTSQPSKASPALEALMAGPCAVDSSSS